MNNLERIEEFVFYNSEDGSVKVQVMLDGDNETIWASQKAIAALFDCTKQNVSYHISKIFASGELAPSTVVKEILTTAQSGARGLSEDKVLFYNLDAIISIGYRINSLRATNFRIWATKILKEYIVKGFSIDDERLKKGGNIFGKEYFEELLERVLVQMPHTLLWAF